MKNTLQRYYFILKPQTTSKQKDARITLFVSIKGILKQNARFHVHFALLKLHLMLVMSITPHTIPTL